MIGVAGAAAAAPRAAQEAEDAEVVANLAAGRAVALVAKDAIVVGTLEDRAEADTLPPLIVPLGEFRVAVILGAAEWVTPDGSSPPVRLDVELRRVIGQVRPPRTTEANDTSDLEAFGIAFLEPLRAAASRLHRKLDFAPGDTFVEILLAQYTESYGPEVWSIRYGIEQDALRGDFYRTRVPRPHYVQLYPPDKGQPHTLIETSYPPGNSSLPALAELLRSGDSRLIRLRSVDEQLAHAADFLDRGESQKLPAADALPFVRAALNVVAPENARQMIVLIRADKGLQWIAGEEVAAAAPQSDKSRPPGAPTLLKKP